MKTITSFLFVWLILALGGCKKFLEHVPESTRAELNTPQKVSQLLGTAYPQANYMTFTESISDNVVDKGSGVIERTNTDPFFFNDVRDDEQDSPEFYWAACYTAIAAANQALDACIKAPNPNDYTSQKGEALVTRAYAHFMLVNFFSKFYNSSTAASDLGIPYVTEPETVVIKKYERRTVSYVYEMIEKDLTEGLPLINDQAYTVPRYHFTRVAANAFATRFYLFKKDYNNVIKHASQAFPGNTIGDNMRPWNTTYKNLSPDELWATYSKATENANLLLTETGSLYGRYVARYRYGMNYTVQNTILGQNPTGGSWVYPVYFYGSNDYFVPKITEYFVRESVNANIGLPYVMVPLFTTEEVLFNRAEANTYLGKTNDVIADLNLFASKRVNNYDASAHTLTASKINNYYGTANLSSGLLQAILDFRRAEFVQEGMRWFDNLRYNMTIVHITVEGQRMELKPNDPRRVFQIPESAKTAGIELNPR